MYSKPGTNGATSVRVMPARPHGPPGQHEPYIVHKVDGKVLDKSGKPVKKKEPEKGHIPLDEFKFRD